MTQIERQTQADRRGFIPPRQHEAVWNAAKSMDIDLPLTEFAAFDPESA
jgi:hypothetical protein